MAATKVSEDGKTSPTQRCRYVIPWDLRRISLTRLVVFDTLILRFLCFRLKKADVSLSKWGYLVPHRLTSHSNKLQEFEFPGCEGLQHSRALSTE
jgi:hypothetical protein